MVVYACNPGTWAAEAGGFQVQGQLGLCSEILPPNNQVCVFVNKITGYTNRCSCMVPTIPTRWGLCSLLLHTPASLVFTWHQGAAAGHHHNLFLTIALEGMTGVGKMAQRVKALAGKPDHVSSVPGHTWWKARTSPDLYLCTHK